MPADDRGTEPLLRLAEGLKELEVTVGASAAPVVAEVRAGLLKALASRAKGDLGGALAQIREAMEKLAALGSRLDPAEGELMRAIAERFTTALSVGDKGAAKETVGVMRRKAGDTKDEENPDW